MTTKRQIRDHWAAGSAAGIVDEAATERLRREMSTIQDD
jgi:hypothetical protein